MKILSWNIHDGMDSTEGPKTGDARFSNILEESTIFCLQETKLEINLPDFKCTNQLRKDSRSGGLCIGVHRAIAENFKKLETGCQDIQAIITKTRSTSGHEPLTIINVYDSAENSAYKARRRATGEDHVSTLELLMDFVAKNSLGKIFLAGDFNARTKNLNHEIVNEQEDIEQDHRSEPSDCQRMSKDMTLNTRGRLFLDFLASTNITLLNGNTIGDIFGEFTSVNYNGSSVVDYMAVSSGLKDKITSFKVDDLTCYSDHKPCMCTLNLNFDLLSGDELLARLDDAPLRFKWNSANGESEKIFLEAQDCPSVLEQLKNLQSMHCQTTNDVKDLNSQVVDVLKGIAESTLPNRKCQPSNSRKRHKVKRKGARIKPKNPWFDSQCINSKRELNSLAKSYGKNPRDQELRSIYYEKRRGHKKLVKSKKSNFFHDLSRDIAEGNEISWSRFKKLRSIKGKTSQLDAFDMYNFCNFFKNLYKEPSLPSDRINDLRIDSKNIDTENLHVILDKDITLDELDSAMHQLKPGKAVAEDVISNEFLKSTRPVTRATICHLFNECLRVGAYPWNTSLVTPLHKKGSLYDPNNYRAIAVASNIGKLFSGILLQRLANYRKSNNPDTRNQLGFCKQAQTSDHILTLTTCIEKYVRHVNKGRVYACFVDYAKAFDTVCREALLYKLWHLGIQGRFFRCLDFMYKNSSARVKLLNKLSEKIDILCGTEQGHPMSPELFKCFVNDLSEQLNNMSGISVPVLDATEVSHLLWADDLVLLALDKHSLQKMLDALREYCTQWGLSVNISKTAIMVFNKSGRVLNDSTGFTYGEVKIPPVREYCYLGITFTLNGSLISAQQKLKQKGLRSYFSLKSMIDIRPLKRSLVFKLFDSLILPIVSYGCQVWFTETWLVKNLTENVSGTRLSAIAKDPLERLHLAFLKWNLGVGRRTSNAAVWGDTGRNPLAIKISKQVFSYFARLKEMSSNNDNCLVKHAFNEQRSLNMSWYSRINSLQNLLQSHSNQRLNFPSQLRSRLREDFKQTWNEERMQNRKLAFYNSAKLTFEPERYIDSNIGYKDLKRLSQFRMSSHKYNIETGRYGKKQTNILNRICEYCTTEDNETIGLLYECPFFEPIVEDENHVLNICPRYSEAREKLNKRTCQLLQSADGLAEIFQDEILIKDMAKFTRRCHYIKFPEDEGKESAKAPKKKDTTPNKSNHLPRSSHLLVS